jgi:hypothetical protein
MSNVERHRHHVLTFQEERARLFATSSTSQGTTASEAASIQQSLSRTQTLLQQELERVSQVSKALDDDDELLHQTKDLHSTMNVSHAKKALSALERAQRKEQRLLAASIVFFWLVVAYILWERLLTHLPLFDRAIGLVVGLIQLPFGGSHDEL